MSVKIIRELSLEKIIIGIIEITNDYWEIKLDVTELLNKMNGSDHSKFHKC